MAIPSDRLLQEAIGISRESVTVADMLRKFSAKVKEVLGADEVLIKDIYLNNENLTQTEEVALNTMAPYLDNRLSGYSAYADLINYYNSGFKSCVVMPIATERRGFGILIILARREEGFDKMAVDSLAPIGSMLGYELESKLEREKSLSMARYFDAAFEEPTPQFIIDRNWSIVKANKYAANLLETSPKNLNGKKILDFFTLSPEAIERTRAGIAVEVSASSIPRQYKLFSKVINDNLVHLLFQDITDLKDTDDRLRVVGMSHGEVFLAMNQDMKIIWVGGNTGALKIEGDGLIGRKLPSLIKERGDDVKKALKEIKDSAYMDYVKLALDNGVDIDVNLKVARMGSGFGAVVSKDMERYAKSARKDLEDVISLSQDFILGVDEMGYIKIANSGAEKILKYKGIEIEGIPVSSICSEPESKDRMNAAFDLAKSRGLITDVFLNFSNKDGEKIPINQNIKTLRDSENKITGYLLIGKELYTKRQLEELESALEEITRKAEKLGTESDLKTQFIFNVSHELKTPLTNINGYSRLLLSGNFGELNEDQSATVKTIIAQADRLMQLIQQILDVAKLSSGKIKLDLMKVNIKDLGENPSIRSLGEMIENKGIAYSFNVDYDVPEIEADPNRLIQVFVNLIYNAYKFTEKGSISIKAMKKGKNIRIEVQDTGIGISGDDPKKLFKRFYQVQKKGLTVQEGSGTGLGLSIVSEIVKLHGGKAGATPGPAGKGSIFWFTLPINPKPKKKRQE